LHVSALTGQGIPELVAAIAAKADGFQRDVGGETIAVSARHAHALSEARAALSSSLEKLRNDAATELLASDLRAALAAYGEITGKVDNERMLDQLFATFCIGK
jgi:tRNA modification GTPase